MASVYDLKPRFQALLKPLVGQLSRRQVTPNMVTLAALAGSALVGLHFYLCAARPFWLLMPLWLFVRMGLNALDGMLAREQNSQSRLGAALNELGDVLSDLLLYLPLGAVYPPAEASIACFALLAALTEFCGLLGQALGGSRRYDGPMGKSDRAALVGVLVLLTWIVRPLRWVWPAIFWGASLLAARTCFNRLMAAVRET
ncbi:MAG TPA: CDP-alcohol phosphatidyltransferase family protein [Candidatus Xenobia bacterium]|jgi:CDP-diacylglycerol--glycerol-3-phosphate 3-phosphatidyltransferase